VPPLYTALNKKVAKKQDLHPFLQHLFAQPIFLGLPKVRPEPYKSTKGQPRDYWDMICSLDVLNKPTQNKQQTCQIKYVSAPKK